MTCLFSPSAHGQEDDATSVHGEELKAKILDGLFKIRELDAVIKEKTLVRHGVSLSTILVRS